MAVDSSWILPMLGGAAIGGGAVALFLAPALVGRVRSVADRVDRLAAFFADRQRQTFADEDAEMIQESVPSPFQESVIQAVSTFHRGGTKLRHRLLVDLPVRDRAFHDELMLLRNKGDGRWLGVFLERVISDPARSRELLELKSRHEIKGWTMTAIEPAYDSAEGLCVWIELERDVPRPSRHAA
ncbi:MAG: hypothetical protein MH204_05020 [Fimbriimonadaceae bacterium]|nr:hypothetical protein [Fimbriimonadaceae bacterium]